MGGDGKLRRREVPWCTLCLVIGAIVCHTCVLVGNLKTSAAMQEIGKSTNGWAHVGLGISRSMANELDEVMINVSADLITTLDHMTAIQDALDVVVSLVGNATEEATKHPKAVSLIQTAKDPAEMLASLKPFVLDSIKNVVRQAMETVNGMLDKFLVIIKPVLVQIGKWVISFGQEIVAGVSEFSTTLDKVEKIMDQIMSNLHGQGAGFDRMLFETWGLFNIQGTGRVTAEDLRLVGEQYSIQALTGKMPAELVEMYDQDNKGYLTKPEVRMLVQDPRLPQIMSIMLRQYAESLSEIGGIVGSARMRDEASSAVAQYLMLVCANNYTKVTWVSDALSNGSLPTPFTAAVYASLCLAEENPNTLKTMNVGNVVIGRMYELHPQHTLECFDLMCEPEWWKHNGFPVLSQPGCIEMVSGWVKNAKENATRTMYKTYVDDEERMADEEAQAEEEAMENRSLLMQVAGATDLEVLQAMPAMARRLAESNMDMHFRDVAQAQAQTLSSLYATRSSRELAKRLMGRSSAGKVAPIGNPNAVQAMNGGVPALPETLRWAQWLKNNATTNANLKEGYCFTYSSQSSSTLMSFATQIQGMLKKVVMFISQMESYATPQGINNLENMVKNFARSAENEVVKAVEGFLEKLVNETFPQLANAIEGALDSAGDALAKDAVGIIGKPIEEALEDPLGQIVGDVVHNRTLGDKIADELAPMIAGPMLNASEHTLGDIIGTSLQDLVNKALSDLEHAVSFGQLEGEVRLSSGEADYMDQEMEAEREMLKLARARFEKDKVLLLNASNGSAASDLTHSPAWTTVVDTLQTLTNIVPTASLVLKNARTEVSKAASTLSSIFALLEVKGPEILNVVASLYKTIWILYFCLLLPLTLLLLYYGFWASGWFGGPQPLADGEEVEPKSFADRLRACCNCCCACCTSYHDTQLCFWSTIVLLQIFVLLMFIVAIVLCILAGVKAFIVAGCAEIYLLGDHSVCTHMLGLLKTFLTTFFVEDADEIVQDVCPQANLLTCDLITQNMISSTILTSIFSFLGAILSMQMIIESAVLHEQARYRRMFNKQLLEEKL